MKERLVEEGRKGITKYLEWYDDDDIDPAINK